MPISYNSKNLADLVIEKANLNRQISFGHYLKENQYQEFSKRLFMKENPFELIRLTNKNGITTFRNFDNKSDKGTLLDFIANRSLEEGKVIPNTESHSLLIAIGKAKDFLKANSVKLKVRNKDRVLSEHQGHGLQNSKI